MKNNTIFVDVVFLFSSHSCNEKMVIKKTASDDETNGDNNDEFINKKQQQRKNREHTKTHTLGSAELFLTNIKM